MDVKKHKGKISALAFSALTILMFGIMPVPMLCYGIISALGETANLFNTSWNPKITGIIISAIVLLAITLLLLIKINNSKKHFDWLIALFLILFVFINGIGLKTSELYHIDFSQNSLHFFYKISIYYFWIFPAIGWYYDARMVQKNKSED